MDSIDKVLFFHDQQIDHAQQIAFSRTFGPVTASHPYDDDAPTEYPEILKIDNRDYERKFGVKAASYTNHWHTDVTALVNPPAGVSCAPTKFPTSAATPAGPTWRPPTPDCRIR